MKTLTLITSPSETIHDRTIRNGNLETTYSVEDFVNADSFSSEPRNDRAWVYLDGGFVIGIVFAEYDAYCEQDALDEAVDSGKLDRFQVTESELKDYETGQYTDVGAEGSPPRIVQTDDGPATIEHGGWPEYERISHLGNAGEPFDIESLDVWEVPMSTFGEDPALMTLERVMDRLEDGLVDAMDQLDKTSVYADDWSAAYKRHDALQDALTLCRFRS
jgi:hypothetical protein